MSDLRKDVAVRAARWRVTSAVGMLGIVVGGGSTALATDWSNPAGGSFTDAGNWAGPVPLASGDTTAFRLGTSAEYTVGFPASVTNRTSHVGGNAVRFDLQTHTYTLNSPDAGVYTLSVNGGEGNQPASLTLANGTLSTVGTGTVIGWGGQTGNLIVASGTWDNAGAIDAGTDQGGAGTANLSVAAGATLHNGGVLTLARDAATNASLSVTGVDALADVDGQLIAGGAGTATVTVSGGGRIVNDGFGIVGNAPAGVGTVNVAGPGSQWQSGQLRIGFDGKGTLNVTAGAVVTANVTSTVGMMVAGVGETAGEGDVLVSGAGSQLNSNRQIQIGTTGPGTLTISAGGVVTSTKTGSGTDSSGVIGRNAAGDGEVTVTGAGSKWTQDGALSVGFSGAGRLRVESGGRIDSELGYLGRGNTTSSGQATVAGAGSIWTVSDSMYVGGRETSAGGPGTLSVTDGGSVTVGELLRIWPGNSVTVSGGTMVVGTGAAPTTADTLRVHADGTLAGSGTVNALTHLSGTLAPGASSGTLTLNGGMLMTGSPVSSFELGGTTPGTQYDRVLIPAGVLLLDGTLQLNFINGFQTAVSPSDTFTIIDGVAPISGAFDNVPSGGRLATADGFGSFRIDYQGSDVVLSNFVAVPEPAVTSLFGAVALVVRQRRRSR